MKHKPRSQFTAFVPYRAAEPLRSTTRCYFFRAGGFPYLDRPQMRHFGNCRRLLRQLARAAPPPAEGGLVTGMARPANNKQQQQLTAAPLPTRGSLSRRSVTAAEVAACQWQCQHIHFGVDTKYQNLLPAAEVAAFLVLRSFFGGWNTDADL
jgi:hypothetical protein